MQPALAGPSPRFLPLTLDRLATVHGWLATLCACLTFWTARALFGRGGLRTFGDGTGLGRGRLRARRVRAKRRRPRTSSTASGTRTTPARGRSGRSSTAITPGPGACSPCSCVSAVYSGAARSAPPRAAGAGGRALAHALDGRSLMLGLATLLLTVSVAAGASRSAMAGAGGRRPLRGDRRARPGASRRSSLWTAAIAISAMLAVIAYADLDRLMSRIDETRQPRAGATRRHLARYTRHRPRLPHRRGRVGKLRQRDARVSIGRPHLFLERGHNEYLQIAAEGGLLFVVPVAVGLAALCRRRLAGVQRRPAITCAGCASARPRAWWP